MIRKYNFEWFPKFGVLTPIHELWTKNQLTGNIVERHLWTKNPYLLFVDVWRHKNQKYYCGFFVHKWRSTSRLSGIEIKSYVQILDAFVGQEKIIHFRISLILACSFGWYRREWRLKRQLTLNTWIEQNRTQTFFYKFFIWESRGRRHKNYDIENNAKRQKFCSCWT